MAGGLGTKLFLQGDTLSADDVNGYFMSQVVMRFATTAARDSAFGNGIAVSLGGDGKPLLREGLVAYIDNLDLIQFYNGSSWQDSEQFTVADGAITEAKLADNSVTSAKIAPGTVIAADIAAGSITNTQISASAAIALSKLATGTAGTVVLHNSSGVPTGTAVSGDISITNTGVTAIASGVIVNADVSASAAIDKTKISGTAITAADSGTVTSTMIADGTIVNADINASAAIDKTKISGTAITAADSGTVTSTMIADGTIVNADINASAGIDLGKLADATIDEKNASYTLALTDKNKFIKMSVTSTANTVTVPTNASVAFPVGSQIHIIQYGSGKTQVIPVSGTVILYATPGTYLRAQYSSATLLKCDTNIWMLMGDLSAS
jgi:sporulation protein YlmC with PRC-barrel domain